MVHKLLIAMFWLAFWMTGFANTVWVLNNRWIFPEGCPKWHYVFADYVLSLLFMLEMALVHYVYWCIVMGFEVFMIQDRFGFRKMGVCTFLLVRA